MARKYRKRRRAELEEQTRRRIVEALVTLHGSIGPARTTIRAVAAEAGVQRATVYRHFPDEASMFAACSAHWARANPFPDIGAWSAIDDADERIRVALGEIYGFYASNEAMLANVLRDASLVPALGGALQGVSEYFDAAVDALARREATDRALLRAALAHALAFPSWRSLVRDNGLARDDAIELMVAMIARAR